MHHLNTLCFSSRARVCVCVHVHRVSFSICPFSVDDDILLEVVMFVGVLCNEGTAPMLVESGLVSAARVIRMRLAIFCQVHSSG